jgi:hypothetical protein
MTRYNKQRETRRRLKFSEMGRRSQAAQAARRMQTINHRALAELETQNLPRHQGDPLGCLQWTDFRTGRVRRWIIRIGDRRDRITIQSPATSPSPSHGWTWFLTQLRKHITTHQ